MVLDYEWTCTFAQFQEIFRKNFYELTGTRRVLESLKASFARARFSPLSFRVIEMERFRMANALVAGVSWGRGVFAPVLFVTRTLVQHCNAEELEAVICHEMSHLALRHLRRRFYYSFGLVFVTVFFLAGLSFLSSASVPVSRQAAKAMLGISMLAALGAQLYLIRRQVRVHEIEADTYAVGTFGVKFEAMASALRKLDLLNDQLGDKKDPSTYLCAGCGHPTTEQRIRLLREKYGERADSKEKAA